MVRQGDETSRRKPGESRSLIYDRRVFPLAAAERSRQCCTMDEPVLTCCRRFRQQLSPSLVCQAPSTRHCHLSAQSCRQYTSGSGAQLESCRATPTRRQLRSRDRNSSAVPAFASTRTCVGRRTWKATLRRCGGLPPS